MLCLQSGDFSYGCSARGLGRFSDDARQCLFELAGTSVDAERNFQRPEREIATALVLDLDQVFAGTNYSCHVQSMRPPSQLVDVRLEVLVMIWELAEAHDITPATLQCLTQPWRLADASKRGDSSATERIQRTGDVEIAKSDGLVHSFAPHGCRRQLRDAFANFLAPGTFDGVGTGQYHDVGAAEPRQRFSQRAPRKYVVVSKGLLGIDERQIQIAM